MKTLTKLAWQKSVGSTLAGAALGAGVGEVKHRRNLAKGKKSSRAKNITGGAVAGGAGGYGLSKAHTYVNNKLGDAIEKRNKSPKAKASKRDSQAKKDIDGASKQYDNWKKRNSAKSKGSASNRRKNTATPPPKKKKRKPPKEKVVLGL